MLESPFHANILWLSNQCVFSVLTTVSSPACRRSSRWSPPACRTSDPGSPSQRPDHHLVNTTPYSKGELCTCNSSLVLERDILSSLRRSVEIHMVIMVIHRPTCGCGPISNNAASLTSLCVTSNIYGKSCQGSVFSTMIRWWSGNFSLNCALLTISNPVVSVVELVMSRWWMVVLKSN